MGSPVENIWEDGQSKFLWFIVNIIFIEKNLFCTELVSKLSAAQESSYKLFFFLIMKIRCLTLYTFNL